MPETQEKVDAWHRHEALDRAHLINDMFQSHLADHPFITSAPSLKAKAERLGEAFTEFYQAISLVSWDIDDAATLSARKERAVEAALKPLKIGDRIELIKYERMYENSPELGEKGTITWINTPYCDLFDVQWDGKGGRLTTNLLPENIRRLA